MKLSDLWRRGGSDATATAFLRWSMDRHAAFMTYRASALIQQEGRNAHDSTNERQIAFMRPNRFRVVSSRSTMTQTAVCDGIRLVEYSNLEDRPPMSYPAPDGIWNRCGMLMSHTMFCGSLLYQFFGGAGNLRHLVDIDKSPIEFADQERAGDEAGQTVTFYGRGLYGHVQALIGTKTGLVHRLRYDSEPLAKMMIDPAHRKQLRAAMEHELATMPPGESRDALERHLIEDVGAPIEMPQIGASETFRDIAVDKALPDNLFDTHPPDGREPVEQGPGAKPALPVGQPAPDFAVSSPAGETVRLSDLRGHHVLIDLWATWCGPCRKGLPDTAELARTGAPHGLRVLAISNEAAETVAEFVREQKLGDLPAFIDASGEVWSKYKVTGIPVTIIVNPDGNLAAYLVGLRPVADIKKALREAGFKGL